MSGSDTAMMTAAPQNWRASSEPIGSGLTEGGSSPAGRAVHEQHDPVRQQQERGAEEVLPPHDLGAADGERPREEPGRAVVVEAHDRGGQDVAGHDIADRGHMGGDGKAGQNEQVNKGIPGQAGEPEPVRPAEQQHVSHGGPPQSVNWRRA